MEVLIAAVVLALVLAFVTVPLRRAASTAEPDDAAAELADLEARKEAKYREIRDAEADRAAGKLTEIDFRRIDAELRREAIEILRRIDRVTERGGASSEGPG
jgi:hypothetical protein